MCDISGWCVDSPEVGHLLTSPSVRCPPRAGRHQITPMPSQHGDRSRHGTPGTSIQEWEGISYSVVTLSDSLRMSSQYLTLMRMSLVLMMMTVP